MNRNLVRTLAVAAMALGLTGSAVSAFSPATTALEGADNLVQKTGGCHRSCEWGPARGWHRHVGARCIPVACAPRAAYPNRCWVDYRGVRHCRW